MRAATARDHVALSDLQIHDLLNLVWPPPACLDMERE
jgi:hypothetical protein